MRRKRHQKTEEDRFRAPGGEFIDEARNHRSWKRGKRGRKKSRGERKKKQLSKRMRKGSPPFDFRMRIEMDRIWLERYHRGGKDDHREKNGGSESSMKNTRTKGAGCLFSPPDFVLGE